MNNQPLSTPSSTDELTKRALIAHAKTYLGGGRSPFYEALTQMFIAELTKKLVALAELHDCPEIKIVTAASKAVTALQAAIVERDEELRAARHGISDDGQWQEPTDMTPIPAVTPRASGSRSFRITPQ